MIQDIRDEFIGENIEVIDSSDKSLIGLKGTIVDETKNSFRIEVSKSLKFKTILKNASTFKIDGKTFLGSQIVKRPEDRIKIKLEN